MLKFILRTLLLALPLSVSYQTAQAEMGIMYDGFAAQMAMVTMQHSVLENSLKRQAAARGETWPEPEAQTVEAAPQPEPVQVNLSYQTSPVITKATVAKYLKNARLVDPVAAQELEHAFATKNVFGELQQTFRQYGLDTTNMADVYTAYFIDAWQAAHGRNDLVDPNTLRLFPPNLVLL